MKRLFLFVATAFLVGMMGCYAGSVDTGLPPSNKVVKKSFAASWIYGLVPPPTVETAAQCPNGVARVETRLSFVNQVVAFITFGIYTPMEITVTCAEENRADAGRSSEEIVVSQEAHSETIRDAFALAADRAVASGNPVFVRLVN